jgi:hypothetical protein
VQLRVDRGSTERAGPRNGLRDMTRGVRVSVILIAVAVLSTGACLPFMGGWCCARRSVTALLAGRSTSITSAELTGPGVSLRFSSPTSCRRLADFIASSSHPAPDYYTVWSSNTLRLCFGPFRHIALSAYISADGKMILSVPGGAVDELLSRKDQELWQVGMSTEAGSAEELMDILQTMAQDTPDGGE